MVLPVIMPLRVVESYIIPSDHREEKVRFYCVFRPLINYFIAASIIHNIYKIRACIDRKIQFLTLIKMAFRLAT